MGRLIDEDALIEAMKKTEEEYENMESCPNWFTALRVIKEQPTAYDVEKVVAELERWSTEAEIILPISKDTIETKVIASGNAIDIVKRGGVE